MEDLFMGPFVTNHYISLQASFEVFPSHFCSLTTRTSLEWCPSLVQDNFDQDGQLEDLRKART